MVGKETLPGQLYPEEMQLLPLATVMLRCARSRSRIYGDIKAGIFPAPVKDGASSRWLSTEIDAWLAARIAERDAKAAAA